MLQAYQALESILEEGGAQKYGQRNGIKRGSHES